ncbi:putative cytochrome P450 [Pseudolycoriella hygida]|uniref:Cytochrome P450 n=1 Tax=Pseudolycoriella hygida TaxID=35572 RepID=A0A9Q0MSQ2_9DIPT|nr:putative cytochrome P450 [Pseudolycoriella hygida]
MALILYTTAIGLGLFALLQWIWTRRNLYYLSWQLPGPLAFPFVGNFFQLINYHENLKALLKYSSKYGTLFRFWIGTKLYVITTEPSDMEVILHHPNCIDKDDSYKFFEEGFGTIGLFTIQGQKWKRHRKLITPTFNSRSVNMYVPIFNKRIKEFVTTLSSKVDSEAFDVRAAFILVFIQMILDTTIGYNINPEGVNVYSKFLLEGQIMATKRYFNPFYQLDFIWKLTRYPNIAKEVSEYRTALFEKIIKERSSVSEDEKVLFLDRLLKISEENSDFTMEDVKGEGNTAIMAGSDTSTGSLAMVLFMLAMHPECQEKAYNELLTVFPDKDHKDLEVTIDDLSKLFYIDMCVKEALRVFPTVAVIARSARGDIPLRTYTIPEGASIAIDIFSLHRSKKYWGDNADQFIPERFDGGEKLLHPYAYMAFSHGPRNCIGFRYALVAIKLVTVYMLLNYRFTTPLKMTDLNYYSEINLHVKEKLMVQMHRR